MSADSQGSEAPEASQGSATPQGADASKGISNEDMNRAITARFKDFEKKMAAQLEQNLSGFGSKLEETLASKLAGILKPQPVADEVEAEKPTAQSVAKDPIAELQASFKRQLREQSNEVKALREENLREKQALREAKMREAVTNALAAHGVTGGRAKHALGYLVDVSKSIVMNEAGQPVMLDEFGDPVDIETGLKAWANTEDAKIYIPPRGTAGSGGSQQNNRGAAAASASPFSQTAQLLAEKLAQG